MKKMALLAGFLGLTVSGCAQFGAATDGLVGQLENPPLEVVYCFGVLGEWVLQLAFSVVKVLIPFAF